VISINLIEIAASSHVTHTHLRVCHMSRSYVCHGSYVADLIPKVVACLRRGDLNKLIEIELIEIAASSHVTHTHLRVCDMTHSRVFPDSYVADLIPQVAACLRRSDFNQLIEIELTEIAASSHVTHTHSHVCHLTHSHM